jgi:hypothetical protein
MASAPPNEFDEETLKALCTDRASESVALEFKRELPGRSDKARAEFLKDVTALANTSGGSIIYGIEERDGAASAVVPIVDETFDEAQRRLGQSAIASIEPALTGLQFGEVRVEGGWCLIARVPASFNSPHRYNVGGVSRFVMREPGFVRDMSYSEVRNAFTQTGEARAQAASFRAQQVERITNGQTWREMSEGPLCTVHVIPISAFVSLAGLDLHKTYAVWEKFIFPDWYGGSRTFNIDGLIVYPGGDPPLQSYVQIYRNGLIEGIFTAGSWTHENTIPSLSVAERIRQTVFKAFGEYQRQLLLGPVILYASLLNVRNHKLGVGNGFSNLRMLTADRDNLLLPDVLIEATDDPKMTEASLRSVMDVLWQAFGSPACTFYNDQGEWAPPT